MKEYEEVQSIGGRMLKVMMIKLDGCNISHTPQYTESITTILTRNVYKIKMGIIILFITIQFHFSGVGLTRNYLCSANLLLNFLWSIDFIIKVTADFVVPKIVFTTYPAVVMTCDLQ